MTDTWSYLTRTKCSVSPCKIVQTMWKTVQNNFRSLNTLSWRTHVDSNGCACVCVWMLCIHTHAQSWKASRETRPLDTTQFWQILCVTHVWTCALKALTIQSQEMHRAFNTSKSCHFLSQPAFVLLWNEPWHQFDGAGQTCFFHWWIQ